MPSTSARRLGALGPGRATLRMSRWERGAREGSQEEGEVASLAL